MQILLLIVIEIAIGIAIGITEFHDVATTSHIGEGDDNHMLHISIYHRVVLMSLILHVIQFYYTHEAYFFPYYG